MKPPASAPCVKAASCGSRHGTAQGKVTVRYQQGLPVAEVQGADRRLQIDP